MTPAQALSLLDQLTAQMKLNREENAAVMQALNVLKALLEPQPEQQ